MPVAGWFDERVHVLDLSFLCFKALKQHLDLRRAGCFRIGFPPRELRASRTGLLLDLNLKIVRRSGGSSPKPLGVHFGVCLQRFK
jgi:hypothetical protein